MKIGHIFLAETFDGTAAHFVALVEALDRQGVEQHIVVRNPALARRIAVCGNARVGPLTSSSVVAYCLLPRVDVAHTHSEKCAPAGLLLTLTRSIPFVLTIRNSVRGMHNPILKSIHERAAGIICNTEHAARNAMQGAIVSPVDVIGDIVCVEESGFKMVGNRAAAEHLRVYRRAVDSWRVPALLL